MDEYQEHLVSMVNELCDNSEYLSEWECRFLDSLLEWHGSFTPPQRNVIKKIWRKVFGD